MRHADDREGEPVADERRPALRWTEHPIHASLVRQRLALGVERTVLAVEGVVCLAALFGLGLSLVTVALLTLVVALVHPIMVWLSARDPQATEVALRSRAYDDFYAPHGALRTTGTDRVWRPRPSVPRAR